MVTVDGLTKNLAGHSSRYRVTNLSNSTANTSHGFYFSNTSMLTTLDFPVAHNGSQIYDLAHIDEIPDGFNGYVVISSDQPITATASPSLVITGPASVSLGTGHVFTADVQPLSLTQPVTYEWSATGEGNLVHMGGLTNTITFIWSQAGTKVITLTVATIEGEDTKTFDVYAQPNVFLPHIEN